MVGGEIAVGKAVPLNLGGRTAHLTEEKHEGVRPAGEPTDETNERVESLLLGAPNRNSSTKDEGKRTQQERRPLGGFKKEGESRGLWL